MFKPNQKSSLNSVTNIIFINSGASHQICSQIWLDGYDSQVSAQQGVVPPVHPQDGVLELGPLLWPAGHDAASAADVWAVCLWQAHGLGHLGLPKAVEGGLKGSLALGAQ